MKSKKEKKEKIPVLSLEIPGKVSWLFNWEPNMARILFALAKTPSSFWKLSASFLRKGLTGDFRIVASSCNWLLRWLRMEPFSRVLRPLRRLCERLMCTRTPGFRGQRAVGTLDWFTELPVEQALEARSSELECLLLRLKITSSVFSEICWLVFYVCQMRLVPFTSGNCRRHRGGAKNELHERNHGDKKETERGGGNYISQHRGSQRKEEK